MIEEMLMGSEANAPTISDSARCFVNPPAFAGYFWSISLLAEFVPYALDNLA
jgi:hypothetical protein